MGTGLEKSPEVAQGRGDEAVPRHGRHCVTLFAGKAEELDCNLKGPIQLGALKVKDVLPIQRWEELRHIAEFPAQLGGAGVNPASSGAAGPFVPINA